MAVVSLRVGTNDLARATAFYDATFAALGEAGNVAPAAYGMAMYRLKSGPAFLVGAAANGEPATHANGGTILFDAETPAMVDAWYAAGMALGGTCEGAPGVRERAGGKYGAYMRDPDGNKLGVYCGLSFSA